MRRINAFSFGTLKNGAMNRIGKEQINIE